MFLVVSRSDVHFGFEQLFFCVLDRARPKNQVSRNKFVHPAYVLGC